MANPKHLSRYARRMARLGRRPSRALNAARNLAGLVEAVTGTAAAAVTGRGDAPANGRGDERVHRLAQVVLAQPSRRHQPDWAG